MKPSCFTIAKLLEVKKAILEHAEDFDMDHWYLNRYNDETHEVCGTTGCIAGWAIALDAKLPLKDACYGLGISDYAEAGCTALGLSYATDHAALFYRTHWPAPFSMVYKAARAVNNRQEMALITAARIDHFIATGE
jgi:hypothetical protein